MSYLVKLLKDIRHYCKVVRSLCDNVWFMAILKRVSRKKADGQATKIWPLHKYRLQVHNQWLLKLTCEQAGGFLKLNRERSGGLKVGKQLGYTNFATSKFLRWVSRAFGTPAARAFVTPLRGVFEADLASPKTHKSGAKSVFQPMFRR